MIATEVEEVEEQGWGDDADLVLDDGEHSPPPASPRPYTCICIYMYNYICIHVQCTCSYMYVGQSL